MNQLAVPLEISGLRKSIYAGFLQRVGAMLLDVLLLLPVGALLAYLNSRDLTNYYYTFILGLVFQVWYDVYLTKRYGGTPGKLLCGITIVRLDGGPLGWREAWLRQSVDLLLSIGYSAIIMHGLSKTPPANLEGVTWIKLPGHIASVSLFFIVYKWIRKIWSWSELVVMLTNQRRRALHDFLAGTVVVRSIYVKRIRQEMASTDEM